MVWSVIVSESVVPLIREGRLEGVRAVGVLGPRREVDAGPGQRLVDVGRDRLVGGGVAVEEQARRADAGARYGGGEADGRALVDPAGTEAEAALALRGRAGRGRRGEGVERTVAGPKDQVAVGRDRGGRS